MLRGDRHRRVAKEGRTSGDHLEQHDSERVDIAARIDTKTFGLLG